MKATWVALVLNLCIGLRVLAGPPTPPPDEGMWLPLLISQNIEEMRALGFKLTAEDIYSVNKSSLKDAIPQFAGGCTSELISPDGLILTNHHCGYDAIAARSTTDHNYLRDGFWAMTRAEEIPNPDLEVKFLVRMEDVTSRLLAQVAAGATEDERERLVQEAITALEEAAIE
ncbi:MAG: S46 family peptidase, partial [Sphingobacteriia bacterium]